MLKQICLTGLGMLCITAGVAVSAPPPHPKTDVYDGWQLGVQAWSFNRFTFFEAVDKVRQLGLGWIQAYPGQRVSLEINAQMNADLSPDIRRQIKDKLTEANVSMIAFGVVDIPSAEAGARRLFTFAQEMGVRVIVSEPPVERLAMIDTLCQEFKIKLAIHNHPKPTHYWDPQIVQAAMEGRSAWIGVCADVGHWVRSELDPVACLKLFEGRIHDVHIKEIDVDKGHDVVWGTGQNRIKGILEELHRQGYQGPFAAEYEHSWDNNVPLIRQSVAYFNQVASALKPSGWKPLLKDDLSNAVFEKDSWAYQDGVLELKGGGDIWTQAAHGDFVLDFEFNVEKGTNSGVFLRAGDREWTPWVEVQIDDSFGKTVSRHIGGAIFDIQAPRVNAMRPAGQWNRMTIRANGPAVEIVLNNEPIVAIILDDWTEAGRNPDGSGNKFAVAYKELPRTGFIGFQDHRDGTKVWYRNIRVKEL